MQSERPSEQDYPLKMLDSLSLAVYVLHHPDQCVLYFIWYFSQSRVLLTCLGSSLLQSVV